MAIAEELLGAGADPEARDSKGNTPLHYAAGYGRLAPLNSSRGCLGLSHKDILLAAACWVWLRDVAVLYSSVQPRMPLMYLLPDKRTPVGMDCSSTS